MANRPAPHGRPSPSDIIFLILAAAVAMAAAFTLGGLLARPF